MIKPEIRQNDMKHAPDFKPNFPALLPPILSVFLPQLKICHGCETFPRTQRLVVGNQSGREV
jgi:hypothetical protein